MGDTLIQRSFAGGELAPGLYVRADVQKYQQAGRTIRNFIVRRTGGVANRSGFKYVAGVKVGTNETFLFPFVFAAADQSFAIEAGEGYFRFHRNGAPVTVSGVAAYNGATPYVPGDLVVSGGANYYCIANTTGNAPPNATYWYALTGNIYEIPTPYNAGHFKPPSPVGWSQSGLVVTITHLNLPPRELVYTSTTTWVLRTITTAPGIAVPGGTSGSAGAAGTRTFKYVVTAVDGVSYEESEPSAVITIASALEGTPAAPNLINWSAVTGASEYNIYEDPYGNGTYGYIGTATGVVQFKDIGQVPDFAFTPPIPRTLFASTNNYPGVNANHGQRRIFAGTHTDREQCFASRVGFLSNFTRRSPTQDDDAITWKTASKRLQPIVHLVSLKQLVMLTDSGEWLLAGRQDDGTLTPTTINPLQQGYVGSSFLTPVVYGEKVLFVQARGTVLRELSFLEKTQGLSGRDLTVFSDHLFRGYSVTDMDFALVPDAVVWCVRSDGVLVGMTYIPDEDVFAWHRHDTDGSFEQVISIPEGTEDAVYVIVKRSVDTDGDGTLNTVRYVERLSSRDGALEDKCFLDSAVTYDGVATQTVTGLSHLRGKSVRVFADGAALPSAYTVNATGSIAFTPAASVVQVGLPITAELESLDLDTGDATVRGNRKRLVSVQLELEASFRGFTVGPDAANLRTVEAKLWETNDEPYTGRVELTPVSYFSDTARVFIRHTDPTPLTVLALLPHVALGG
jgi:hypothetical protein